MSSYEQIEQAIAALEAESHTLAPAVIETSLAALREQLRHSRQPQVSGSAMRGERKQVTVMFADISGFTAMSEKLDPEAVRSLINGCFELLGEVIDRYGGHIDKFIGDEIMALFGAPKAHENDPERALRAALDMMTALQEFNRRHAAKIPKPLALHFGINSGLVIAGGIGTSQRQDYSVMGDTVNLAARLEGLSEAGEILIGENTYRLTAPLFEFETLKPVKVKGKEQPVRVHRLLRAKTVRRTQLRGIEGLSSPLVGRKAEFEQIKEILARFQEGQGNLISVVGEAGLGKSRLIEELRLACAEEGRADWFEGRAVSYGENARYLVARDVLHHILGVPHDTDPAEVEARLRTSVRRLLPPRAMEIYPYLAHLLNVPLDDDAAQRIRYLQGEALHQRIQQAVRDFILARSRQAPLVLVWEDLHWADPSSLQVLTTLLDCTDRYPLLLLLIYRPVRGGRVHAFKEVVTETLDGNEVAIPMQPLSEAESRQLLTNLLGQDTLPESTRQLIIDKAEGNPFYLEEVIRSLINSQVITKTESGWQISGDLNEIKLPDTLQGVIMSRIDQLDPHTKRILQIASVIGRNFSYRLLDQVFDRLGEASTNSNGQTSQNRPRRTL